MELVKGSVVISKAGRDKGYYLAVTQITDGGVYVCDGKERPVERPKKKNPLHLAKTHFVLSEDETATNRSLKKALKEISCSEESEVK
ncbi:MAG: KOW domain-containing RNA-binding protein [Clostridia bacterium]|nr:KOW domain-containing RNA-binding protein [Clostridia bacterium]